MSDLITDGFRGGSSYVGGKGGSLVRMGLPLLFRAYLESSRQCHLARRGTAEATSGVAAATIEGRVMSAALCRAPLFLDLDLIAGRTCDDQVRKPSKSRDRAD